MMACLEAKLEIRFNQRVAFFNDKERVAKVLDNVRVKCAKSERYMEHYKSLEKILTKGYKGRVISPKKQKILKEFYTEVNQEGERFSLNFILVNNAVINKRSFERIGFFESRHTQDATNRIVETLPSVLSYSLDRTQSIYDFLESRHTQDATNRIVETLPAVLSCSLDRTQSIYDFLDSRHRHTQDATNRIVETLPSVFSCSLDRTKSIYDFLDSRHTQDATNRIVETLPAVLGYSLDRTKSIYDLIEQKGVSANNYIANFPLILYFSPKFIENNTLAKIIEVTGYLEEKLDKRIISANQVNRNGEKYSLFDTLNVVQQSNSS